MKAKQQGIEGYVVMDLRVVRRWAFMPPAEPAWQRLTIRYELEK